MKFEELNIISPILSALTAQGYVSPTPIQEKALPPALKGRDVLGCAQTGTGKTCAFAVPILQRLQARPNKKHPIRALILTPTRELAIQIQESFQAYGQNLPLRSTVIFGGVGQTLQVEALHQGTDILVATPGRLQDLHNQGEVDVSHLEILVLDEADRMLDMGFIHDVRRILEWLPARKQTLFFSATMPEELNDLVNSLLHNPVRVAVDPISSPVERIRQTLYYVDKGNKTNLLAHLLEQTGTTSALVFTRTKHGANKVAQDLKKRSIVAEAIHGNKSQTARQAALSGFKAGTVRVLVATDIAARGLDIEELPYVFNYNLPDVPETYIHRIGRTGRAGREGVAISFCDISETEMLKGIEKLIGRKVPVQRQHPYPMVVLEPPQKDKKGRIINPEDQEARQAAREKRQSRSPQPTDIPTEREETPVNDEKKSPSKSAKKKKNKSAKIREEQPTAPRTLPEAIPKPTPVPEEEPALPTALRTSRRERTYVRPVRQTSLEDFLKEIIGDDDGDDYDDFSELEQKLQQRQSKDRFLDATDRMFATHSSRYRDAFGGGKKPQPPVEPSPKPEAPAASTGKKKGTGKKKSTPAEQPVKASTQKEKPAQPAKTDRKKARGAQTEAPAPEKSGKKSSGKKATPAEKPVVPDKKQPEPTKKGKKARQAAPAAKPSSPQAQDVSPSPAPRQEEQQRLLQPRTKKKKHTRNTPPPMERSHYATQKDSTEQKSLMKPYYINKND